MRNESHTDMRARERYGIRMYKADYDAIIGMIVQGKAKLLERQGYKANWIVDYKNRTMIVAYDEVKRRILTFLPRYILNEEKKETPTA